VGGVRGCFRARDRYRDDVIGQGAGGDRVEAAGMYAKGKKMVIGALILLPILAALPEIVKFLLAAGTPSSSTSGLANDVPTWG